MITAFPPYGHCQWLDAEGHFCGRLSSDGVGVWCAEHRARVYLPARPENRRIASEKKE
jgi:hypothetical protein